MKVRQHCRAFTDPSFPMIAYKNKKAYSVPTFLNIHWQQYFEFCYISHGEFEICDSTGNQSLQTGDLCIFSPGEYHGIRCTKGEGRYAAVYFKPEVLAFQEGHFFETEFTAPLQNGTLRFPRLIRVQDISEHILACLEQLFSRKEKTIRLVAMLDLCVHLLPFCTREPIQSNTDLPTSHPAVRSTMQYIYANYTNQLHLQELADRVHLHPNYLCALWKKETGETVFEYQNRLRIYKSREMLRQQTLSVAQIAEILGFSNADFFRKKFQELVGITPTQYRKYNNDNG